MIIIKPIHERLLIQLASYKFLTISQFAKLGVGHPSKIKTGLQDLREQGLIRHAQYSAVIKKKGSSERIHFLKPKGAKILLESRLELLTSEIKYPKSTNSLFRNDYFHRISTINSQISCIQWLNDNNCRLSFFDRYFDKTGSQRSQDTTGLLSGVTRLLFSDGTHIEPDAIFGYRNGQDKPYLYILEVFNGNDTKRVVQQLTKASQAIIEGLAGDKYHMPVATRLLATFENESNMKAVIERLSQDENFQFDGIDKFFFFALAETIKEDFGVWLNLKGQGVNLLEL